MKISISALVTLLVLTGDVTSALAFPEALDHISPFTNHHGYLTPRKGGGGGGGRGGGGSSGGSSSGSSGGSSSGSSSGGRTGGTTSGGTTSGGTSGGRTTSGSSSQAPSYAGGRYAGGSTSSYSAGSRSPSGIVPALLVGSALGLGAGILLSSAYYSYPYSHPYHYYNRTSSANQTAPVQCICAEYNACGCDDDTNTTTLDTLVGNGSVAADGTLAASNGTVRLSTVNSTSTLLVNGTLANATDTSDTDSTTTDDGTESLAVRAVLDGMGWAGMVAAVAACVLLT